VWLLDPWLAWQESAKERMKTHGISWLHKSPQAAASISTGSFAQEFNYAIFADLAPIIYAASDSGGFGIDFLAEAA
jgi:hypothetical protein